jgi:hypothetical protein
MGLRVSREEEIRGLDIGEHGMEAYAGFQIYMTEYGLAPAGDNSESKAEPAGAGGNSMKLIIAMVQPHKVAEVKKALDDARST